MVYRCNQLVILYFCSLVLQMFWFIFVSVYLQMSFEMFTFVTG